ncbi:MAG TPA: hypothetical protein VI197_31115 [Polyangiaceae bacterium]
MFARRVSVAALGWLLAAFSGVACGDDESQQALEATTGAMLPYLTEPYSADCDGYTQRLRDCGILGEGPFTCSEPDSEVDVCVYECVALASCGILSDLLCDKVRAFPLEECFVDCNAFQCDSGEPVTSIFVCDGYADCSDGSDESSCFVCGSGEVLPPRFVCDYNRQCLDGSDEHGCETFECDSGETVPDNRECDLIPDCPDGSDEKDCDMFVCEVTGEKILPAWQCDAEEDCLDGSDEQGCAPLNCP